MNLCEGAVDELSERMTAEWEEDPTLTKEVIVERSHVMLAADFGIFETPQVVREAEKQKIETQLRALVGMQPAKDMFKTFRRKVEFAEATGDTQVGQSSTRIATCL